MGDAHVYANHVDPLKEQLQNSLRPFPVSGFAVISNLHEQHVPSAACFYAAIKLKLDAFVCRCFTSKQRRQIYMGIQWKI